MSFKVLGSLIAVLSLISVACQNQSGTGLEANHEATIEYQQGSGEQNAGLSPDGTTENQQIQPGSQTDPGTNDDSNDDNPGNGDSDDGLTVTKVNPALIGKHHLIPINKKWTKEEFCTETYNKCEAQAVNISQKGQCANQYDTCMKIGNCNSTRGLCLKNGGDASDCSHKKYICILKKSCSNKNQECIAKTQSVQLCSGQYEDCIDSIETHIIECAESRKKCYSMGGGSGECNGFYEGCMKNM